MPSAVDSVSRKLHIYLGLYFLFFTWLFCLSGVVLNHPKWRVAGFWNERRQDSMEVQVSRPRGGTDLEMARSMMDALHIRGEISGAITRSATGGFNFRVVRPGDIYDVKADFNKGSELVDHIHVNGWGVLNMLHSFTGVRRADPTLQRNWWATGVWGFFMDAFSAGLIVMVLSGIWLWWRRGQRRRGGMIALALGLLIFAGFLVY
jgi:hypothetical protein